MINVWHIKKEARIKRKISRGAQHTIIIQMLRIIAICQSDGTIDELIKILID